MNKKIPSIVEATKSFEAWLATQIKIDQDDLRKKHEDMAASKMKFFRSTYYRWAQLFPLLCPSLMKGKIVLSVADEHDDQFAIWINANDEEVWGVNDFDEAYPLPFANDLVRLAASVIIVKEQHNLAIKPAKSCDSILTGYHQCLISGAKPFILCNDRALKKLADDQKRKPKHYWKKLLASPETRVTVEVLELLKRQLPKGIDQFSIHSRTAGEGSLGRQRIDIIAPFHDAYIAEEAKSIVASACVWAAVDKQSKTQQIYEEKMLHLSTRSIDPSVKIEDGLLLRKLSPAYRHIELGKVSGKKDQSILLQAMGYETGNIHLGTPDCKVSILRDLDQLNGKWLLHAAQTMLNAIDQDWKEWKQYWSEQTKSDSR